MFLVPAQIFIAAFFAGETQTPGHCERGRLKHAENTEYAGSEGMSQQPG
jgi:hypothetical protein